MAFYRFSTNLISRSKGQNAVNSSAYRSGMKLTDKKTGRVFDYTKKKVSHTMILAPENAPKEFEDREVLWNAVEESEKRKDSQLSRECRISIPREFSEEEAIHLVKIYCQAIFVEEGMVADLCFHGLGGHNPHVHVMLTTRIIENNDFGKKERAWNSWKDKTLMMHWRKSWADFVNNKFKEIGSDERIDHRTNEERGLITVANIEVPVNEWNSYQRNPNGWIGDNMQTYLDIQELNAELLRLHEEEQEILARIEAQEKISSQEIEKQEEITNELNKAKNSADEIKEVREEIDALTQLSEDDFTAEKSERLKVLNRKEQELIKTLRKDKKIKNQKSKKYH